MELIRNDNFEIKLENGVCFVTFLSENYDLAITNDMVKSRLSLTKQETFPMLSDIRGTKSFTREARHRLSDKEAEIGVNACAIILKSKVQVAMYQFFVTVSRTKIPTRFFTKPEEGLAWLQQFKIENK